MGQVPGRRATANSHGDGVLGGIHELVTLAQVVAVGALVKDVRNNAVKLRAKGVMRRLVCKAPRGEDGHAEGLLVRGASDIVQGARVSGEEGAHGACRRGGWGGSGGPV